MSIRSTYWAKSAMSPMERRELGRGLIRWNMSSYSACRNIVLSQYSVFTIMSSNYHSIKEQEFIYHYQLNL